MITDVPLYPEADPENQRARHLVRQFDEAGERTIPVLTKPDRIEPGDEGKWLDMLRNRTEIFKHGWFCVRQPGLTQLQARITPEVARENEREFFETTRPWSLAEPDLRARLGTGPLSKALGQKLFESIAKWFASSSTLSFSLLNILLAFPRSRASSIAASRMFIPPCAVYNTRSQRTL